MRLRQREHDLRGLLVDLQLGRAEVGLVALSKAKGEYGPFLVAEEDQRSVTAGLTSTITRDALLKQAAAEIGVDQTAMAATSVASLIPSRLANFANQRFL